MPANSLVPIGQVVGAHGINGAVKVYFFEDRPRTLSAGQALNLIVPAGRQTRYSIEWSRPHKRNYLVGLAGISDREQAKALQGAQIVIPRSDLPVLEDDAYYWTDLIGMDVYTVTDRYLGQIKTIIPTGGNDVYVVRDKQAETLVPALKHVVLKVDLKTNTMRVDLPEGL